MGKILVCCNQFCDWAHRDGDKPCPCVWQDTCSQAELWTIETEEE